MYSEPIAEFNLNKTKNDKQTNKATNVQIYAHFAHKMQCCDRIQRNRQYINHTLILVIQFFNLSI